MGLPKNQQHAAWLREELPGWVKDGLVTAEAAAVLTQRYPGAGEGAHARAAGRAMVLFGILGAVLVGGGIILLLAHNWEDLGRGTRALVSFTPLVCGQALVFWLMWTNKTGTAWRESAGTFVALMSGACLALVSQTYNLGGSFADFMLTWTLLSLPLAYLLRATLPAVWYCIAAVIWGFSREWGHAVEPRWIWGLLLLVIPFWVLEASRDRYHPRPTLLAWAITGAGSFAVALGVPGLWYHQQWAPAYGGWFAVVYLAGRIWFSEGRTIWHRPLQFIGVVGASVIALMLTFDWAWRDAPSSYDRRGIMHDPHGWRTLNVYVWPLLAALFWLERLVRRDVTSLVVGVLLLMVVTLQAVLPGQPGVSQFLLNAYVLATGVALLVLGLRKQQLGTVNGGMLILSALILCRFLDSGLGFVLRGVAFIVVGAGFLVTNLLLLRRKGAAKS